MKFWDDIKNSQDPEDFKAYLKKFPDGLHADLARNRFRALGGGTAPRAAVAPAPVRSEPSPGTRRTDPTSGIEVCWIPAGRFTMGSPAGEEGRSSDEGPQHDVRFPKGFWMGRTEVTQAQWQAVMGSNPSHFTGDGDRPVEQVSWDDCQDFLRKLNAKGGSTYRLPTEAEWEYASRAGATGARPGDLDAVAWYGSNSGSTTHAVGQKQANAWGLQDMLGNVWEWCEDLWHGDYSGAPTDGSAWTSGGDSTRRVLRGGSWFNYTWFCRSAFRLRFVPSYRYYSFGFRVVVDAPSRTP